MLGTPKQTVPPSIAIKDLYPDGNYPVGEIMEHPIGQDGRTGKDRMTSEEKKAIDRMNEDVYKEARLAAEAHRQTRQYMQSYIKPGMTMIDIWYVCLYITPLFIACRCIAPHFIAYLFIVCWLIT